jgi:hypothetical protein
MLVNQFREGEGVWAIGVEAEGVAGMGEMVPAMEDFGGVVDRVASGAAGNECAIGMVAAVEEAFAQDRMVTFLAEMGNKAAAAGDDGCGGVVLFHPCYVGTCNVR